MGGHRRARHRDWHDGRALAPHHQPCPRAVEPRRPWARRGRGDRRAPRRQPQHRERAGAGHGGSAAAPCKPLPDHPARRGRGGAGPSRAGHAHSPGRRRSAPPQRALRHAAGLRPRRHHRGQGRGRAPDLRSWSARRGHHRPRHATDERLGGSGAGEVALSRHRRLPPHGLGRERGRPRGEPVRRPSRRQARLRRGLDGAARGAASLARFRFVTPVTPRPAASVLLVRPGAAAPAEVYMIRRQKSMRFLGGFYAFPGGKVDPEDGAPDMRARCRGLTATEAERLLPSMDGAPALAYWVAAARELLEETGVLPACDAAGRPVGVGGTEALARIEAMREAHMAKRTPLAGLLAEREWYLDLGPFRYLSHFITPPSSPIRFTARFFLAPVPDGQEPRLFEEEASEGAWIDPADGFRRFGQGEMPMAEPAFSGLSYLSAFDSLDVLWAAHADGRH